MKKIPLSILITMSVAVGYAQPVAQRTVVPVELEKVDYPNVTGNTRSTLPQPGTVFVKDGTSVKGKITLFKKTYFVPG